MSCFRGFVFFPPSFDMCKEEGKGVDYNLDKLIRIKFNSQWISFQGRKTFEIHLHKFFFEGIFFPPLQFCDVVILAFVYKDI